jgi:hypothetical protein
VSTQGTSFDTVSSDPGTGSHNRRPSRGTGGAQATRPTSKDRRHAIRKRIAMRPGQYAAIVLGGGLYPTGMLDGAGLIRVTPEAIVLYRPAK